MNEIKRQAQKWDRVWQNNIKHEPRIEDGRMGGWAVGHRVVVVLLLPRVGCAWYSGLIVRSRPTDSAAFPPAAYSFCRGSTSYRSGKVGAARCGCIRSCGVGGIAALLVKEVGR